MPKITRPQTQIEEEALDMSEEEVKSTEEVDEEDLTTLAVEELNPDEKLWADGPTAGQAKEWKDKYGDVYVTSVTTDYHVAWRTLNRSEFKAVVKQIEQLVASGNVTQSEAEMVNEELVTQICALFPSFTNKDFAGNLAGLPSILSQQIMAASGFTSVDVVQL